MAQGPAPPTWWRRALRVGLFSFVLAVTVSYLSGLALGRVHALIAVGVVLVLVAVGVGFDILGTAVTAADDSPLNAMAAKRINGARQALWLVRNADAAANFCNDVVGDVAGAVTGAAATTVALQLSALLHSGPTAGRVTTLGVVGLVAALTVGGKAAGKTYAITRAITVVFIAGKIIHGLERVTRRSLTGTRGPNSSRRRTT